MSQQYQYQVMMRDAKCPITIVSFTGNLHSQWQYMRRNDVHRMFDGHDIMINFAHVVCITGPDRPFNSFVNNPYPENA